VSRAAAAPVAAVDVGTQSVRLLVGDGGRDLDRCAVITHLGRGLRDGRFDPVSVDATLEALRGFRRRIDELGAGRVRAIATEAVRRSAEPASLLGPAAEVLGVELEVVSGDEEGRLSFAGATAGLDPASGPFVTIDLGGGSCEFAVGTRHCEHVASAAFGATALTEAYLGTDRPRPEDLTAALSVVQAHVDEIARTVPGVLDASVYLGLGGTFTTMAAVEIGLDPYDGERIHGFELTRAAAEDVFRTLVTESYAERIHNPGLPEARARTIVGGSCAVVAIMRHFGLDSVRISERDLLDGIVAELLA